MAGQMRKNAVLAVAAALPAIALALAGCARTGLVPKEAPVLAPQDRMEAIQSLRERQDAEAAAREAQIEADRQELESSGFIPDSLKAEAEEAAAAVGSASEAIAQAIGQMAQPETPAAMEKGTGAPGAGTMETGTLEVPELEEKELEIGIPSYAK